MFERLIGIATFKAPVYREVAEDKSAMSTAAAIVVIMAIIGGFSSKLFDGQGNTLFAIAVTSAILSIPVSLINWGVSSWVLAKVAGMFGGKTDTSEMLRVTGFVYIFTAVNLIGLLTGVSVTLACVLAPLYFVAALLMIIGNLIGVREAAEFSTGNAIVTSIIAGIASFIITSIGQAILGFILNAVTN
jgi:hypothetical protein